MSDGGQLRAARELSLGVLARDARLQQLREAARELGKALFATAEDRELWNRLESAASRAQTQNLSSEHRTQLEVIIKLDWARLLNESGYQPPPPAEAQAVALQQAVANALHTGRRANLDAAREKLRTLGDQLIELGGEKRVSRRRLRRQLRNGTRVAGKLLITIGVIAAGGALTAAIAAAAPPVSPFVVSIGVGLVADGAGQLVDRALDRALREPYGAGLLGPSALDSTGLESYGLPGSGRWITVYANPAHAWIVVAVMALDTADYGGPPIPTGSGPRWRSAALGNLLDRGRYSIRHPVGL